MTAARLQPSCGAPPVDFAYVEVMDELQNSGRAESELAPKRHSCCGPSCVRPLVDRHRRLARRWRTRRCRCPGLQAGTRSVLRREAVAETVVRTGERRVRLLLCSSAGRAQAQAARSQGAPPRDQGVSEPPPRQNVARARQSVCPRAQQPESATRAVSHQRHLATPPWPKERDCTARRSGARISDQHFRIHARFSNIYRGFPTRLLLSTVAP